MGATAWGGEGAGARAHQDSPVMSMNISRSGGSCGAVRPHSASKASVGLGLGYPTQAPAPSPPQAVAPSRPSPPQAVAPSRWCSAWLGAPRQPGHEHEHQQERRVLRGGVAAQRVEGERRAARFAGRQRAHLPPEAACQRDTGLHE